MGLVGRHKIKYIPIGPVHIYRVDLFTHEGELARMNKGEYCAETRVLIVTSDYALLAIDNDATDVSYTVDDPKSRFKFDPVYPDLESTIQSVGAAIAAEAEEDWKQAMEV